MYSRFGLILRGLALAMLMAGGAAAQSWKVLPQTDPKWRGGVICPMRDSQTGNAFCLSLACAPGGEMRYVVSFVGGELPQDIMASLSVDGSEVAAISLRHSGERRYEEYVSQTGSHPTHRALQALKGGNLGELVITYGSGQSLRHLLSLRGSSRVLAQAAQQCRMAPPPPPPPVADPLAEARAGLAEQCSKLGGRVEVQTGAVTEMDLDGDGLMDRVVDFNAIQCDKARSLVCGSAGCPVHFYRQQPEGGFVRVSGGHVRGYGLAVKPVLTLHLHGSACGKVGAAECSKSFTVEGNRLVPLR